MRLTIAIGALVAAGCVYDAPVTPENSSANRATGPSMQLTAASKTQDYILDFTGNDLPADLATQVQQAGGVLTTSLGQIGVAVATTDDPGFAERASQIQGVFSVMPDIEVQWLNPRETVVGEEVTVDEAAPPPVELAAVGAAETFRLVQWAPDAISAPAAWDAGATGAGVRVAVLDGGIHSTHLDIAPNLDVARSRSFVPNALTPDPTDFVPFNADFSRRRSTGACDSTDTFWHGTHVAGIIAAAAQNVGTVGIAPNATLIGVKVLNCGSGQFSWILNAIVYASLPISEGGAGADVINMSLGAEFTRMPRDADGRPLRDQFGKTISANGNALLARAIGKAATFAYQNGVTVVASMGNSSLDLDHTADVIALPAMSPHVIAVSATGPVGWAATGATNFDEPASYTNFGQSAVDFAAPGGNDEYRPLNQVCSKPRIGGGPAVVQLCFGFDFVFAPVRGSGASIGSYNWAEGTSMASPMVAGVAALIIGKFGRIGPAAVEQRLRQSADDLGQPGNDDFYGAGRVNALKAIQ